MIEALTVKPLQKLFNETIKSLAKQGFERSQNSKGCAYRGLMDRKCAIGIHITDEEYEKYSKAVKDYPRFKLIQPSEKQRRRGIEGCQIADFHQLFPDSFPRERVPFMKMLQKCHDCGRTPEEMKAAFRKMAKALRLNKPKTITS